MDNKTKACETKKLISLWANDAKRRTFLESYKEWCSELVIAELGLHFYFYTLPCGVTIVAMEHNVNSYYNSSDGEIKRSVRYYLQEKDKPFIPNSCGIWSVADKLKQEKTRMQKELKAEDIRNDN